MKTLARVLAIAVLLAPTGGFADDVVVQLGAGDAFVVEDDTGATERLRIDEATGDISRNGVLFLHTRGVTSLFLGDNAGNSNVTLFATGIGANALLDNVSGISNTAVGASALRENTTGHSNAAFGAGALVSNNGVENTALGFASLVWNTSGSRNSAAGHLSHWANTTGNDSVAIGDRALTSSTLADGNTAVGSSALSDTDDVIADSNTAVGMSALRSNTQGGASVAIGAHALESTKIFFSNTAVGDSALRAQFFGDQNTAIGRNALLDATDSTGNTAFGANALAALDAADWNVALGRGALQNLVAGDSNVAIGTGAGIGLISGISNLYIKATANPSDDSKLRIGSPSSNDTAFVAGVFTNTVTGGSPVVVNSAGDLGVATSSRRYKRDIVPIGEDTPIQALRPVSYRYRDEFVDEGEAPLEYGLIAEEVAAIAPELVDFDEEGRVQSVRSHLLDPLLVGEVQRQRRTLAEQAARIESLLLRIERLEADDQGDVPGEVTR